MRWLSPSGVATRLMALAAGDLACVGLSLLAGYGALEPVNAPRVAAQIPMLTLATAVSWVTLLDLRDFYALAHPRPKAQVCANLIVIALGAGALAAAAAMAMPALNVGRRFYLAQVTSATTLLALWRLVIFPRLAGRARIAVGILGAGLQAELLADEIRRHAYLGYQLLEAKLESAGREKLAVGDVVGAVMNDSSLEMPQGADVVVISEPERPTVPIRRLLESRMAGLQVFDFESFYEYLSGKIPLPLAREAWLVFAPGFRRPSWAQRLKRLLDIAAAAAIGLGAAPLMLLAAALIKLDSTGPVLYSQERVGLNNRMFRLHKFRSMRHGAESLSGAVWAASGDPRVSRVGRIIRRFRIDELPQLWNVLSGDMSLIGPRPERPEIVQRLAKAVPLYHYRHFARPGITGWAQVCAPYGASVEDAQEKLCYDLYYIKNWSLVFDVQIVLQTVKVVLLGRGAR